MSTRGISVVSVSSEVDRGYEANKPSYEPSSSTHRPIDTPSHLSLRVALPSSPTSRAPAQRGAPAPSAPSPAPSAPSPAPLLHDGRPIDGYDSIGRPLYSERKSWNRRGGKRGGKNVWAGMTKQEIHDELDRRFRRGKYKEPTD